MCCLHVTLASEIKVSKEIICKPVSTWDLSQTKFYNIAYDWTHHAKLTKWSYSCSKNCCDSSYTTNIKVPKFIHDYITGSFSTNHISKQLCLQKQKFSEDVTITHIPFIDQLQVACLAETKTKNAVIVTMKTDPEIPWYVYPLQNLITKHIQKSFADYIDILQLHLCDKNSI